MKWKYILSTVVIFIVCVTVWDSETFQRNVFPKKFWAKTVNSLEQQIKADKLYIENTRIELMKLQITSVFDIRKSINTYKAAGMDIEKARELANEPIDLRLKILNDLIESSEDSLAKNKRLLIDAKKELSKYQRE